MPHLKAGSSDQEIVDASGRTWHVRHEYGWPIRMTGHPERTLVIFRAADERLMAFTPGTDRLGSADYLELLDRARARAACSPA